MESKYNLTTYPYLQLSVKIEGGGVKYNLTTYPYLQLSVKIEGGRVEVQSYNLSLFTVVSKDSR